MEAAEATRARPPLFAGFYMPRPDELALAFKNLDRRLAQAKPGMSQEDVKEKLGTPVAVGIPFRTPWHGDRVYTAWGYSQDDAWGFVYFSDGKVVPSPLPPSHLPPFPDPQYSAPRSSETSAATDKDDDDATSKEGN
jgi:hypothetical protein